MKRRLYMLLAMFVAATAVASAQDYDPKFGVDPGERENNIKVLNFFQDAYMMKQYNEALSMLPFLIEKCPKATVNLYIRGVEIYRNKMLKATSKEERTKCLDSMMYFYDMREVAFGDHPKQGSAYIKEQKATMFYDFAPTETKRATTYFRDAIQAAGNAVDPNVVVTFFNMLTESFKLDDISPESYIADYQLLSDALANSKEEGAAQGSTTVEQLFISSGAASCDNIEKIFRPKYEADQNNGELIKKILTLFQRSKCQSDFQFALLEKYYQVEPSPEMALMLASAYEERKNYTKALEFIEIAIANETDNKQKTNHYLRAAGAQLSMGNYRSAAEIARKILALDSENGMAHLIYAGAVAGGVSQSCSDFDRQCAYWVVVDNYRTALKYFEGDPSQMTSIQQAINSYAANFPKKDDIFMYGLDEGAAYSVNCGWISGRTVVRGR